MNRQPFWLITVLLLTIIPLAQAQQPRKIPKIGFIRGGSPTDTEVDAFRQGLYELGYVQGKNIIVDCGNTEEGGAIVFPVLRRSWSA